MVLIMNTSNGNQASSDEIAMVVGSPMSIQSDDDDDNCQSSAGSACEEGSDFMTAAMDDEVTAQLAAAGNKHCILLLKTILKVRSSALYKADK